MLSLLENHYQQELCLLWSISSISLEGIDYEKRKLKGIKNQLIEKSIYINESLGPVEQSISSEAEKRELIVTQRNCKSSVLCFKTGSDEEEFVRVDYLNDLDKLKNPIKKQARQNINNTREWKQTHVRMEEARLRAESYEKTSSEEKRQMINKNFLAEA